MSLYFCRALTRPRQLHAFMARLERDGRQTAPHSLPRIGLNVASEPHPPQAAWRNVPSPPFLEPPCPCLGASSPLFGSVARVPWRQNPRAPRDTKSSPRLTLRPRESKTETAERHCCPHGICLAGYPRRSRIFFTREHGDRGLGDLKRRVDYSNSAYRAILDATSQSR